MLEISYPLRFVTFSEMMPTTNARTATLCRGDVKDSYKARTFETWMTCLGIGTSENWCHVLV